jgi:PAS domain S-box-containing protein
LFAEVHLGSPGGRTRMSFGILVAPATVVLMQAIEPTHSSTAMSKPGRATTVSGALLRLTIVTLLPLALATALIAWQLWQSQEEVAKASLRETAVALALAVDRDVAAAVGHLEAVSASQAVGERNWIELHRFLSALAGLRAGAVMALVDQTGHIIVQSNVGVGTDLPNLWGLESQQESGEWSGQRLPVSSQGMTRRAIESRQLAVSGLYLNMVARRPTVGVAIPVQQDGEVRYAAAYTFPPEALSSFQHAAERSNLRLLLVDRNGVVIAKSPFAPEPVGSRIAADELLPDAMQGVSLKERTGSDGVPVVAAYAASAMSDWTVRASQPRATALAPAIRATYTWVILFALVFIAALLASRVLSRRLAAPLSALAARAQSPSAEPTARVGIHEIDVLAARLEQTAASEHERRVEFEKRTASEERERAAEAVAEVIRDREEQLRIALEAGQMGTWRLDFATSKVRVDERLRELWRLPVGVPEVDSEDIRQRIHPDDVKRMWTDAGSKEARPEHFADEFRVSDGEGGWRWLAGFGKQLKDDSGHPLGMVGVNFDVTARRLAQEELLESERRFEVMADSVPVIIWVTDADGRLEFVNREYERFFGMSEADVRGAGWQPLIHPEDKQAYVDSFLNALKAGQPFVSTARVQRDDGQWRWVNSFGTPRFSADGRVVGMVGASPDITEQRFLESEREQLLAAERSARSEAEQANHLKDEFLATLSHELRSPLAVIISWSHVLLTKYASDPEIARAVKLIHNNALTQSQLISDLLDMSRIVAGKAALEATRLDLSALVEEIVAGVRPEATEKGIDLTYEGAGSLAVLGDAARLRQVFGNLLANALKFTPSSGTVAVRAAARGAVAEVAVSDTGEGIELDFLGNLFDRFRQADGSIKRRHGGLGLGLAIVKQLVEMHGGEVFAESEGLGRGAQFTVRLPLLAQGLEETRESIGDVGRTSLVGLHVLTVEDQSSMREYLCRLLGEEGIRVSAAASASDAIRLLRDGLRPDLLISDLGMPGMDGYELLATIRSELGLCASELPAIALTAFARDEDRQRALNAGFAAHVGKPFHPNRLFEVIRAVAFSNDRNVARRSPS